MKVPITKEGYEDLKRQLETLLSDKRPKLLKTLEEARAHGDLSENADYDAAKEAVEFLQKKISELEEILKSCEIVEVKKGEKEKVEFGSKVKVKNLETNEIAEFRIVGPYESDIKKGKISVFSPLGKALLGKTLNEEISFQAPSGEKYYEIIGIE